MWSFEIFAVAAAVFVFAGVVKGAIGLGMPTISLALLAVTFDLKAAIAIMLVPTLAANIWQSLVGGALARIVARLWTMLAMMCVGIWFGVGVLARADAGLLSGVLGGLLCLYSAIALLTPQIPAPGAQEGWMSPVIGGIGGVLTGVTGSFIVPGAIYLQALALPRDELVQAIGVCALTASTMLLVAFAARGLLPPGLGPLSVALIVPALAGMAIGQRVRRRIPEGAFRSVFLAGLMLLGGYLAIRAFA